MWGSLGFELFGQDLLAEVLSVGCLSDHRVVNITLETTVAAYIVLWPIVVHPRLCLFTGL